MYFYRPEGFVYTRLDSFEQLHNVLNIEPGRFLLITDRISLADEQAAIIPQATLAFRTYPAWLERYNYFHWLDRSRTFSMYAIDADIRTARKP